MEITSRQGSITMPMYKSHKEVGALKIAGMEEDVSTSTYRLAFEETGHDTITVSREWYEKHRPQVGGYYVVYKDGYASYSPAEAFEDGYLKME